MAYPIYPGMDVKFKISTEYEDFLLTSDPFEIVVKDHIGRVYQTIKKNDCFWDKDGCYYFTLENVRQGQYIAFFRGDYEDDDYNDQRATVTDQQFLMDVPGCVRDCHCHDSNFAVSPCCHKVHYQLVTTVSIDGEDYLADCDGKYILTSDGNRICFKNDKQQQIEDMGKVRLDTLTGDQFKQLIEGRSMDGTINTVPELFDAVRDVPDTETVREATEQTYDEKNRTLYINGAKPIEAGSDAGADTGEDDI